MKARVSAHECGQENNSEQHSCPTRLNSLLQLHPSYMATSVDLFLFGSPYILRCRTRESAVSFSFSMVAAITDSSNRLRCVFYLTRSPFTYVTLLNPFPRTVIPQLILSMFMELHAICRWPEDTSRPHRDGHPLPPSTAATTQTAMRASEAL